MGLWVMWGCRGLLVIVGVSSRCEISGDCGGLCGVSGDCGGLCIVSVVMFVCVGLWS